jgi:hypothetical protein
MPVTTRSTTGRVRRRRVVTIVLVAVIRKDRDER